MTLAGRFDPPSHPIADMMRLVAHQRGLVPAQTRPVAPFPQRLIVVTKAPVEIRHLCRTSRGLERASTHLVREVIRERVVLTACRQVIDADAWRGPASEITCVKCGKAAAK